METVRPRSAPNRKTKLARTIQKVINLRTATRIASNNGIGNCILAPQDNVKEDFVSSKKSQHFDLKKEDFSARNRALVAKLFAGVSSIKACYAELQMAQNPYNGEAIQVADQAVVDELKEISELKLRFLRKEFHLSPQVTLMLAEIQEQQSLMKTYEITINKMESEKELKDSAISALKKHLEESIVHNKSLEKKLNSSGCLSILDNIRPSELNSNNFIQFLHYTLRSTRSFVKLMIRQMEQAHWDLDLAVKFIEPDAVFSIPNHGFFAFESFVCKTMFEGFNHPNFTFQNESQPLSNQLPQLPFDKFRNLKSVNPKHFLSQNPNSSFAKFTRSKYQNLVHAKMECSLFGNLNQRKLVSSGGVPDSAFFAAFAEMSRRVWMLHCLAFSLNEEVVIFQVGKNCRFSEVYMECVTENAFFSSGEISYSGAGPDLQVGFTVVPGFKIGKTVIQCQVYLSPVTTPANI